MIVQHATGLGYIPKRIVSLVPSQTELLFDLGLEAETTGITKFCIHPQSWFKTKQRVGGTKTVDPVKVRQLQPDLIIANKEENVKEQVEELAQDHPVWLTDVNDLQDALQMITDIGELTGKQQRSLSITEKIRTGFGGLQQAAAALKTAYLIWRDPYMTAGAGTFIHDMLGRCGFNNIYADQLRYPEISVDELRSAGCELLLLSSEPYPFKQKHIDELQQQLTKTKILLVDGEMFSWYGSRLLLSAPYFKQLITEIQYPSGI